MKRIFVTGSLFVATLLFVTSPSQAAGRDGRMSASVSLLGGQLVSEGSAKAEFTNAAAFPTLTTGEKIPLPGNSTASGIDFMFGYTFSQWFSWHVGLTLAQGAKNDSTFTTASGTTHNVSVQSKSVVLSPFIWTGYPIDWFYLQAGLGFVVEGLSVTSNITTINNFDTGSAGLGLLLGAGVDYPLTDSIALIGGLRVFTAKTKAEERTLNSGTTNEVKATLEERTYRMTSLRLGVSFLF